MLVALLSAYLLALAALTLWVRRRHGAQEGRTFFVAGGELSAFTTACSLTATSVGGSSTVVTCALVYRYGLAGIWIDLAGALGYGLLGLLVARHVRETNVSSIAELAGQQHGEGVRRLVAVLVVIAEIAWLALLCKAAAALLAPALPQLGQPALVAITAACVVLYTLAGGQYVVSYSDVAQLALMAAGLWVVAPLVIGGELGQRGVPLAALDWRFPTAPGFGWGRVLGFLLLTGLPHLVGSDIYAKVLSAKDGRAAARGALGAALAKLLFALAIAFLGLAGKALLPALTTPSALLGTLVHQLLSPTLAAVVLVALAATMMSSADQVLLSAITMVDHDLAGGRRPRLRVITAVIVGGLALILALLAKTVLDAMKIAYTLFAAGLSLPLLAGVLWPRRPLARGWLVAALIGGALLGGGLHAARLLGLFSGQPVIWGLALNAVLLFIAALRGGDSEGLSVRDA
jgi:SSS family solute:Na+ symporter